jgi:cytochrome P450/NADPH-cytochrome P450 reductase
MDNAQVPKIGVMTTVRTARSMKDETLIEMAMELAREYGPIFQLPGSGPRNIVVSGFALADEICDDRRFDKALGTGLQERRAMVGDGLFTAYTNEPNWHKAHNILLPTFSRQAMKGYIHTGCSRSRSTSCSSIPRSWHAPTTKLIGCSAVI